MANILLGLNIKLGKDYTSISENPTPGTVSNKGYFPMMLEIVFCPLMQIG